MRGRALVVWLVLGAVLLLILNLPFAITQNVKSALREGVAPLQELVSDSFYKLREGGDAIRGLGGALEKNEKMASELLHLRNEVRALKQLEQENAQLRRILTLSRQASRQTIPSHVIGRDISGWWQTVRLGKGTTDGIQTNMAVVTSEGLIGKTTDVSLNTSDVLLLSDPSCKVSGLISRTATYGIVSGQGPGLGGAVVCTMQFINKSSPVRAGDEVLTSGLGGVYPRGLLIGYVERVSLDPSGLYQQAEIIPRADIGALSYVFVMADDDAEVASKSQDNEKRERQL